MPLTTDLADLLAAQMRAGSTGARATFAGKDEAFSYVPSLVNSLVSAVSNGRSANSTFQAVKVTESAKVTAWTGPADKPITATVTAESVDLSTFPGVVTVKSKDVLNTAGLGVAIEQALYGQALAALDASVVTDLLTVGTPVAKAATLATIAEAQAQLLAGGFSPGVVVVSAALYGTLASTAGVITAGFDPTNPIQSVLGSRVCVSPSLTGAQAIVLDPAAVTAIEHESSPCAILDVHARANTCDVVIEVIGGHVVSNVGGVVPVKA